jgi:hypothetical protein
MVSFPDFEIPSTVETPEVCVDRALMDANIRRMAAALAAKGVAFRPHVKSHKSLAIARRQILTGAIGITAATIGEAEVFVDGGVEDIFIAYPLWVTNAKASSALHLPRPALSMNAPVTIRWGRWRALTGSLIELLPDGAVSRSHCVPGAGAVTAQVNVPRQVNGQKSRRSGGRRT